MSRKCAVALSVTAAALVMLASGCRNHMPHAFTWPAGGDIQQTHAKPPEGGYYSNWDPYAVELEVTPLEAVNPVRTQHYIIATVKDKDGNPLPNRRVEWIISSGSVGDIVEVDESGWRASRGYKVDNHYAVSHTNNFDHVLDMGTDDPSDDIQLTKGQTWCVITSPIEGDTHLVVYAPGIYDRTRHKVFAVKHWYDVQWEFPPPATNPIGTTHEFVTYVRQASDGQPLAGYEVTYEVLDGPDAVFEQSGGRTAMVLTDANGEARVTLRQAQPVEGTNNVAIDIVRPANEQCCKPAVHIASGRTAKTWIGPQIAIAKSAPATEVVNRQFQYSITVTNPSQVDATNVVVTDNLPEGISYVSSVPEARVSGQTLTWSLGTLAAGGASDITVTVTGPQTGTFENCAEVAADYGLHDRACATTVITAPALAIDKQCPAEVLLCDEITYVITVRNTGDAPASNVRISDALPAGLALSDGRTSITENLGTLGAGESRQLTYTARASETGTFENTVSVMADGGLEASATCTTVVRRPVLEVTKTGPEMRYIGRNVAYEITVSNTGDAPARDTVLTDVLPAGTTFVGASDGGQVQGGQVVWNLGTLGAGESRSVTLTVKPGSAGTVRNTATARAYCAEASAETSTRIEGIAAILLEVIDVEDPIEVGANITYIITVTNQGSAVGTNIRVSCELPAELQYVSSDGLVQATVDGAKISFAPLPELQPGAKATYRVIAKGVSAGDVRFRVSMVSDQMTSSVDETESTHVYE